ncbi:alpha-L-rhamnosidase [Massilibacteroides vaginae]|uniref:alpha-L-rhamnosidase n=1 Tax=Massilibacteroides vaginae TaxID=1673718 RepID=UPI000A1CE65A|nr:glycosyl hydrolase [Massilibacteroides vaginae]
MNNKLLAICFSLLAAVLSINGQSTDWPNVNIEAKPWTRWWWLGSSVDKANLTYNMEMLHNAGIGGVEITPIYGVKGEEQRRIEYLSPTWMEMLSHSQAEAKRLGMEVDMTMGTGWPFGGPQVSIEDAATRSIFQEYTLAGGGKLQEPLTVKEEKQAGIAQLSRLMAYSDKGDRLDITNTVKENGKTDWVAPKGKEWRLIALFTGKTFQKVKRAAPGGEGYVLNHFDKEAVARYFDRFDKAFKTTNTSFPHSFFNDSYEVYGGDWTADLLEQFEKRRGYKLENYFPEFIANGNTEKSARIISDYRETIGDLLQENFTSFWVEWAHERGISIRNQAHGSPANLIDLYATVDIPECEIFGITDFDIPGLRKDSIRKENDGDPTVLKYASSAAHIAGKKYTSAETFTWLTEHFRTSLSQCKPEIDQMFLSGVNHVYFHGNTYSPKEAPWPGWKFYASVDMSPTNSIWRDAPAFFDYITRTQSFLQYGEPDNDFLLYLPIYDIWEEQRENNFLTFAIHGMRERLPKFYDIVARIRDNGYDLDYISDKFIQTTVVENGALKTQGGAMYKALILPAVKIIPQETLDHLFTLAEQGATLIFAESYPKDIPGMHDLINRRAVFEKTLRKFAEISSFSNTQIHSLGKGKIITGTDYASLLNAGGVEKEEFKRSFGGEFLRRKHESGHHYFLVMLQNKQIDGWIPFAVPAASALFFDPMTGNKGEAAVRNKNGVTEIYLQLKPGQSIILKTFDTKQANIPQWTYLQSAEKEINLDKDWSMRFVDSEPVISETFHLNRLTSWTNLPDKRLSENMGTARYQVSFDFEKKKDKKYALHLGDVRESARVFVNGKPAGTLFAVPFEVEIGDLLINGTNTIEVEVTNLPANRISAYDRKGVNWRIFEEINFVSITYQDTRFDNWGVVPSGLLGPVTIKEFTKLVPLQIKTETK